MDLVDLHVHSSASDGTLHPAEVTRLAISTGLSAYALTDHDTIDGVEEALSAARGSALEVIPGTELSCLWEQTEIHILGLYLDHKAPVLSDALTSLRTDRANRNRKMVEQFQKHGFAITEEDLSGGKMDAVITRAHFARVLVDKGYVSSMEQAFKKYLSQGKPYFLPKQTIAPAEAIRLIRSAGGFPALAHPVLYRLGWKKTEALTIALKEMGMMGIEVYYSSHTAGDSIQLNEICRRCGLLPTGGSDFHGSNKPDIHLGFGRGGLRVSALLLDDIRSRLGR